MLLGRVKWYNSQKGYGFIEQESGEGCGEDIFVHVTQLEKIGLNRIDDGQKVGFEIYEDRGRRAAGKLQLF